MILSRRTLLRGAAGAALALPFLDAMRPRRAISGDPAPPKRLMVLYMPNGIPPDRIVPTITGPDWALPPYLTSLQRHRQELLLVTDLTNIGLSADGEMLDQPHDRAAGGLLTGEDPFGTGAHGLFLGQSFDQVVADHYRGQTPLASLELTSEGEFPCPFPCEWNWSISYRSFREPVPRLVSPSEVFRAMFGGAITEDFAARQARLARRTRVIDAILPQAQTLSQRLGAADQQRLQAWLDGTAALESQVSQFGSAPACATSMTPPVDGAIDIATHTEAMLDLAVTALECDQTRVVSYMFGAEAGRRIFPFLDIWEEHHALSHHDDLPQQREKYDRIMGWQMDQVGRVLDRLRDTPAEDGSPLLDHTLVLVTSAMGDGNIHEVHRLPAMLFGRTGSAITGGRHLAAGGAPFVDLCSALLETMEMPPQRFGRIGTGPLQGLREG